MPSSRSCAIRSSCGLHPLGVGLQPRDQITKRRPCDEQCQPTLRRCNAPGCNNYRCPYCRKAFSEVADLVKTDGNIRFVVKEFPLLREDSTNYSRFALAMRMLHGDDA